MISVKVKPKLINLKLLSARSVFYKKYIKNGFNTSFQEEHKQLSHLLPAPLIPQNIHSNSWYSIRKLEPEVETKTILKSESTDITQPTPDKVIRTVKYRVHPTPQHIDLLKNSFHAARTVYNKCVEFFNDPDIKETKNIEYFRRRITYIETADAFPPHIFEELKKVPSSIRDGAIQDFMKAVKTQFKLVRQKKITHFEMHYRKKRSDVNQSIVLARKHMKILYTSEVECFKGAWKGMTLECKKEIFKEHSYNYHKIGKYYKWTFDHDCRLAWTRDNKFYFLVPTDIEVETKTFNKVVSLDPGEVVFQTTYDNHGVSYLIGEGDSKKLDSQAEIAAILRSGKKRDKINGQFIYREAKNRRERKGIRKAANRIEQKIKNKISDLHHKTVKFLCDNYNTVIIPKFETQKMVTKKDYNNNWQRNIGPGTSRRLVRWGHYKFKELLIAKGEQTGTKIIIGDEIYSSKTCSNCRFVKDNLGSNREYNCNNCNYEIHRDVNGARNIMMINWKETGLDLK